MQITGIRAKNFLSFGNDTEQIDLKDLNIVVGPNNSGKTNLFRTISFVGDVFTDRNRQFTMYHHNANFEQPFEVSVGIQFNDEEINTICDFFVCSSILTGLNPERGEQSRQFDNLRRSVLLQYGRNFFRPLFRNIRLEIQGHAQELDPVQHWIRIIAPNGRDLFVHPFDTIRLDPNASGSHIPRTFPELIMNELRQQFPEPVANYLTGQTDVMPRVDYRPTNIFDLVFNTLDSNDSIAIRTDSFIFAEQRHRLAGVNELRRIRNYLLQREFHEDRVHIFNLITTLYNSSIIRTSNIRSKPRAFLNPQETLGALTITTTDLSGEELPSVLFRLKNSANPKERRRYSQILENFKQITGGSEFDVGIRTRILPAQPTNELTLIDPPRSASRDDIGSLPLQGEEGIRLLAVRTREGETVQYELVIQVVDGDLTVSLDFAAAGLFESLILLVALLGHERKMILLDEPALNLHPILQKRFLGLVKDAISSHNQIVMITHSPYFIDYNIVAKTDSTISTNLLYVRKQQNSSVILMPDDVELKLKPHLFRPEIFFSKCSIIIEGAADLATLTAISEGHDSILGKHDIALIDTWGEGSVKQYLPLLNSYKIPFVAMVDNDYDGPKNDDIIILEKELEDELRKLGWDVEGKRDHVKPKEAYEFISAIIKEPTKKEQILRSVFWQVIESALTKSGAKAEED